MLFRKIKEKHCAQRVSMLSHKIKQKLLGQPHFSYQKKIELISRIMPASAHVHTERKPALPANNASFMKESEPRVVAGI